MAAASLQQLWNHTQRIGRDSYRLLLRASVSAQQQALSFPFLNGHKKQQPTSTSFRDILLEEAQDQNSPNVVARQFLLLDKQWNDLRYYGFLEYLRRQRGYHLQLPSSSSTMLWSNTTSAARSSSSSATTATTSTTTSSSSSTTSSTTATPSDQQQQHPPTDAAPPPVVPPMAAKVPFMVTNSMKEELRNRLGYDDGDSMKKLTPIQAQLILEHNIRYENVDTQLPQIERDFQQQQQQLQLQQQKQLQKQQQQQLRKATTTHADAEQQHEGTTWYQVVRVVRRPTSRTGTTHPSTMTGNNTATSGSSKQEDDGGQEEEIKQPEEVVVLGMYLEEKEAEMGRSVHEELAKKHYNKKDNDNSQWTYEIRKVVK